MKTIKLFFIALALYFIGNSALAQTAEHKTYDYITIVTEKAKPKFLYVSYNGEKYEEIKIENSQEFFEYNEAIKFIKKYEKEGYELFANNFVFVANIVGAYNYFLLRREHKE